MRYRFQLKQRREPMKANCWYGKRDVRVEEVPEPKIINRGDAVVKITTSAICGSDLHLYNKLVPTMEKGDILGHDFMGEIVEMGREEKKLKQGVGVWGPFLSPAANVFFAQETCFLSVTTPTRTPGWRRSYTANRRPGFTAILICSAASPAGRPSTLGYRSPMSVRSKFPTA